MSKRRFDVWIVDLEMAIRFRVAVGLRYKRAKQWVSTWRRSVATCSQFCYCGPSEGNQTMADTSVSVEVNISYNDPRLKKLHEELEKLVRDGESDIHVVMVVDGKCYQLDMQPMPTTDGRHLNDDRSSFEEQALRMCEFPNPNSLLFRISRLAYSVAIGRAEAAKGGRALDSVFDDLQKCSIAVHEEAVKSLASPTDSTGG